MGKRFADPADLDHVLYKIEMFCATLILLPRINPGLQHNAVLESLATHTRNLHEFYCDDSTSGGYMKPQHFVSGWKNEFPFDGQLMRRVAAEVAHLTYDRKAAGENRGWDLQKIASQIIPPSIKFIETVATDSRLMDCADNRNRANKALEILRRIRA